MFSIEYLLLTPRSALEAAPEAVYTGLLQRYPHALLLAVTSHLRQRPGLGGPLKRHPFSGQPASAGELLHTP